jgi:hypothetical protein
LLGLSKQKNVEILIPMQDAVLIQHDEKHDVNQSINIFQDIMTGILSSKIQGKASVEAFCL